MKGFHCRVVMKDFNSLNLRKEIEPVLATHAKRILCKAGVKMETAKSLLF
jgi:hypothetical protein